MNWIEILGTRYRCGSIVLLSSDFLPIFGFVTDIIVLDVETTLCVKFLKQFVSSHTIIALKCVMILLLILYNSLTYVIIMYFQCRPKTLLILFH